MIAFLFIALAGVARAAHTVRKDLAYGSKFWYWFRESDRLARWYVGGNNKYKPSSILTADFWHFFVFVQNYSWVGAVVSTALDPLEGWWMLLYLTASPIEGWFFTYFYHYVFPNSPAGNLWHFLKRVLSYRNSHVG